MLIPLHAAGSRRINLPARNFASISATADHEPFLRHIFSVFDNSRQISTFGSDGSQPSANWPVEVGQVLRQAPAADQSRTD
jgi:hypothetical protein